MTVDPAGLGSIDPGLLALGVAVLEDGQIVRVNPRFGEAVGHGSDALEGRPFAELVAPDDRERVQSLLDEGDAGGEWTEVAGLRADSLPFVLAMKVGGSPGGSGRQTVATVGAGATLVGPDAETVPEYVRQGDWEQVGLDRVLSHDVRGALRGAGSFLTLLEREIGDHLVESAAEFYTTASASTARADHMVDQIVQYLRLTVRPVQLTRLPLGDIIEPALAVSASRFEGDSPVLETGELPTVWGNAPLLTEALAELVTNSRKFTDDNVSIHVDVDSRDEGWVYLHLRDDGLGIDPEFSEDAFEMFRLLQPKGRYPGVGMGLAMVRRVIEVQGGRCWIEPSEPPGTTVRIRLALAS
jgi:signal transduction histidine kinase